jgi:hypothetical protein
MSFVRAYPAPVATDNVPYHSTVAKPFWSKGFLCIARLPRGGMERHRVISHEDTDSGHTGYKIGHRSFSVCPGACTNPFGHAHRVASLAFAKRNIPAE